MKFMNITLKRSMVVFLLSLIAVAFAQQAAYTSILFNFKFKFPASRVYTESKGSSEGIKVGDVNVSTSGVTVNGNGSTVTVPSGNCKGNQEMLTWEGLKARKTTGYNVFKEFMGLVQKNGWKFTGTLVNKDGGTYKFTKQKRTISGMLNAQDDQFGAILCEGKMM
jgi:hypothetical protein